MYRIIAPTLACSWLLAAPIVLGSDSAEADRAITKQVLARFAEHTDLGTQLTVRTMDGVVYLDGFASTSLVKSNAESLARSIDGVKKVIDNIGISK